MALARLAILTLSCVLLVLFYSSTCNAIPVPPGKDVGKPKWKPHPNPGHSGPGPSTPPHTPAPGTGHTTPPPGKGHTTPPPGKGHTTPPPGKGHTTPPPGKGKDHTTPAPGKGNDHGTPAPGKGKDHTTPAPGTDHTTPAPGKDHSTPAPGKDHTTPAPGKGNTTPPPATKPPTTPSPVKGTGKKYPGASPGVKIRESYGIYMTEEMSGDFDEIFDTIMKYPGSSKLKEVVADIAYGAGPSRDLDQLWYMGAFHKSGGDEEEHATFRLYKPNAEGEYVNVESYHLYRDGRSTARKPRSEPQDYVTRK